MDGFDLIDPEAVHFEEVGGGGGGIVNFLLPFRDPTALKGLV